MKQISAKRAAWTAIGLFLVIQAVTWLVYLASETPPPLLFFVGGMTGLGVLAAAAVFLICRAPNATRFKCLLALLSIGFVCVLVVLAIELWKGEFELRTGARIVFYGAMLTALWASKDKEIWVVAQPGLS